MDDEEAIRITLVAMLERYGRVLCASNATEALDLLSRFKVDVAFVDINLGIGPSGLELLDDIRARWMDVEVIVCTVEREPRVAVDAIKRGAFDYVTKEFSNLMLLGDLVQEALVRQRARRELLHLRSEVAGAETPLVMGRSDGMRQVVESAAKVARLPTTVLLLGESGTGKEVLARHIHRASGRDGQFVAVNVAAIPRELLESTLFGHEKGSFTGAVQQQLGKFELADGGTLFLDEIGDLPLELQPKLLRVIQEREVSRIGAREPVSVDVRMIAATHVDLLAAMRAGRFREDLYYRLNIVPLRIPPLRERREDVAELVLFFADKHAKRLSRKAPRFSETALAVLFAYDWPGNVRELENLVERILALKDKPLIEAEDVPLEFHYPALEKSASEEGELYAQVMTAFERNFLQRVLQSCDHGLSRTARRLGLHRNTLRSKLEKYKILSREDEES